MKYIEIIKRNRELELLLSGEKYKVAVLSNITISQLKEIIEFDLRIEGVNAEVVVGGFDVIVQDSVCFAEFDAVIVIWEVINIVDGIYEKSFLMTPGELDRLTTQVEAELGLVLHNLRNVPIVLFNKFTSMAFDSEVLTNSPLNTFSKRLNIFLDRTVLSNQILVNVESILSKIGVGSAIDMRQFHATKALYSIGFFKAYSKAISSAFMAINGRSKKVLVLDCDNTLWGGILGEDGFSSIRMSEATRDGLIFNKIQSLLLGFKKSGIILALCSKNNWTDVDEVLEKHPDMILHADDFVVRKVNWQEKHKNIQELSVELNLGLDSFIFIDDSEFEVGLVEKELPEVKCVLVPKNLSEYPLAIESLRSDFYRLSTTKEDADKTKLYAIEGKRKAQVHKFSSIDDYLVSLKLEIEMFWGGDIQISRAAQMSQKTNQFNLVTKRYSEEQITELLNNPLNILSTFSIRDRYGDYGVSGLIVIRRNVGEIERGFIDTFLMSCRVLGRNIEYKFLDEVFTKLGEVGVTTISARYIETKKNNQVKYFYDQAQFCLLQKSGGLREYELQLSQYKYGKIKYIKNKLV